MSFAAGVLTGVALVVAGFGCVLIGFAIGDFKP